MLGALVLLIAVALVWFYVEIIVAAIVVASVLVAAVAAAVRQWKHGS